jgi:hypothetical protein
MKSFYDKPIRILREAEEIDLEKLEDSKYLLNVLMQCEDLLDKNDSYAFVNWESGIVIRGPIIKRHWISFSLRYPHSKMPDPKFALRLLKIGVQCQFERMKQEVAGNVTAPDHEPDHQTDWMVTITVPRRLLDQTEEADLETYDDEINQDDVVSAQDIGLDDESSYHEDEQNPEGMDNPEADANAAMNDMEQEAPQQTPRR